MGFREGNVSTFEVNDRRGSYKVSSFSLQDGTAALGSGRGPVLKYYYFLQVSAVLTASYPYTPDACPCEAGGVCLLAPSERGSQLMGSGCVIVTVKMLSGDFIFLFSDLIPFFYIAFDSNEKSQSCSFPVFFS